MPTILPGRHSAQHKGALVVFIIGMRINHFHKVGAWMQVARAMPPMLAELSANPNSGFLGAQPMLAGLRTVCLVQYWRDFASLESYARNREAAHWPAWVAFNTAIGDNGAVGIFHETYCVSEVAHETIYVNMPEFGLGKASGVGPIAESRNSARDRMRKA